MPSSLYTGGASDFANVLKEYTTTQNGISLWEQALTGLQQAAQLQTQSVQASADYDISQAYANYLQNQRQISQSSNLGTGFRDRLESNLQSAYRTAFAQTQLSEAQNLYDVQQQYQENLSNTENQFTEIGEELSNIDQYRLNYLQQYGSEIEGYGDIDWSGDLEQQNIYTRDAQGNLVLTNKGQQATQYALLNRLSVRDAEGNVIGNTSFADYLREQNEDAYNAYMTYGDIYRSGFGIKPGQIAITEDQRTYGKLASDLASYYDNNLSSFDSYEEAVNSYLTDGLGVENGYEKINNLNDVLNNTIIKKTVNNNIVDTEERDALEKALMGIGIKKNDIITIGVARKANHQPFNQLAIDINGENLSDVQKYVLEQQGFVLQKDGTYQLIKEPADVVTADINTFFAR